jgi:hypothetical protein
LQLSEYASLNEALDKANDKTSLSNADKVARDLRQAIDDATSIRIFYANGTEATAQNVPAPPGTVVDCLLSCMNGSLMPRTMPV